jgi:hypothetical protein
LKAGYIISFATAATRKLFSAKYPERVRVSDGVGIENTDLSARNFFPV